MPLFTLGYEGLTIEAFVAQLKSHAIKIVVDVRELPLSRKRGFSKRALSQTLEVAGLAYVHQPAFGCPKSIRHKFKADGDWASYERAFSAYLSKHPGAVSESVHALKGTVTCLICFEADYRRCHRSLVASAINRAGGPKAKHLLTTLTPSDDLVRAVA